MDHKSIFFSKIGCTSSQIKIWSPFLRKHNANILEKFNESVSVIIVGIPRVTPEQLKASLRTTNNLLGVNIVSSEWVVQCIKSKAIIAINPFVIASDTVTQPESHKMDREADIDNDLPMSKRAKAFCSQPPACMQVGTIHNVAAYSIGTLCWGVTYPDALSRPTASEVALFVKNALQSAAPHVLFIDTADTYCADSKEYGYVEKILKHVCNSLCFTSTFSGSVECGQSTEDEDGAAGTSAMQPMLPPVIGSKGGMMRINARPDGWRFASYNSDVDQWEACIRGSVERLGGSRDRPLQLWQVHHCHAINWNAVMSACDRVLKDGLVLNIGLCNVTVADVKLCQQLADFPIVSVQNHYSLWDRAAEKPLPINASKSCMKGMLQFCTDQQIPFIAHGALGGTAARRGTRNLVADFPQVVAMATAKQVSPYVLTLAWMRHHWPCILHIVGSRHVAHFQDLKVAYNVRFTREELEAF